MRIIFIRKQWCFALLGLIAAAGIFTAASLPFAVSTAATERQLPIYCVDTGGEKLCAISFDAAWGEGRMRLL